MPTNREIASILLLQEQTTKTFREFVGQRLAEIDNLLLRSRALPSASTIFHAVRDCDRLFWPHVGQMSQVFQSLTLLNKITHAERHIA